MLEGITWKEFGMAVGVAVLLWYLYVMAVHFRREIKSRLMGDGGKTSPAAEVTEEETDMPETNERDQTESAFAELEMMVTNIRHGILEKAGKGVTKEELLKQLQHGLTGYDGLHRPAFRIAINNFIMTNAREICNVTFSEEELESAWKDLFGQK